MYSLTNLAQIIHTIQIIGKNVIIGNQVKKSNPMIIFPDQYKLSIISIMALIMTSYVSYKSLSEEIGNNK